MKKHYLTLITTAALLLPVAATALGATDPVAFPTTGLDARSLGRGGTVIASPPGVSAAFGNPAILVPGSFFSLSGDYVNDRDAEGSWSASIVDTSSDIRGALSYHWSPEFAGFEKNLWGVAFAQNLTRSLTIGESFHRGTYEPDIPGAEVDIWGVDVGLLLVLGDRLTLGYVVHNIYEDSDLLEPATGIGAGVSLPWTIHLTADYEEVPNSDGETDLRAGVQFTPFKPITGRLGFQDLADGTALYTAGISYQDANGTIDAAILYDSEEKRTQRVIFAISMGM